jgi:hypothetical protein
VADVDAYAELAYPSHQSFQTAQRRVKLEVIGRPGSNVPRLTGSAECTLGRLTIVSTAIMTSGHARASQRRAPVA